VAISNTDVVVQTRFHNVLLALLLNKPAISISFHQKCDSLIAPWDCRNLQDIKHLGSERLIEQFASFRRMRRGSKA